jgi:8-oxo-dGTP diphosphatase
MPSSRLPMAEGLLLCQQNNYPFWVLPGGTLEPGEGIAACAIREMQEEAGLTITLDKLLYVADWVTPTHQVHEVYFLGRYASGVLQTDAVENIQRLQCVTPAQLDTLTLQPACVAQAIRRDWPQQFAHTQGQYLGVFS